MDAKEEQQTELDVLQSIYFDEFTLLETEPLIRFKIHIQPDHIAVQDTGARAGGSSSLNESEASDSDEERDDESDHNANDGTEDALITSLWLHVTYPAAYPAVLPDMTYEEIQGLSDEEEEALRAFLQAEAEANVGTPLIFTIVSGAKEYLSELLTRREEAERRKEEERSRAEEEAERLRHAGTAVTPESFAAWRTKFEAERKKKELAARSADASAGIKRRPTGKELFQRDKSLGESDAKYYEEGDEDVDLGSFQRELEQIEAEEEDAEGVLAMLRAQPD